MERHFAQHDYFVTTGYSIADIAYAYTHVAEEGNFDLRQYPAILAWFEPIATQPHHLTIDR